MKKSDKIKEIIKESYGNMAKSSGGCGCGSCGSNLGLGCGNPVAIASLKEGDTVLDLGSGAGFDVFLVAKKIGKSGKAIGVDMTDEMLIKARENARKSGFTNVEFKKGDIENLPIDDNLVDVVISNCVINLAPDKARVFKETYRVLKMGGRLMVSDVVLIKPLPDDLKNDKDLLIGCVSGAILKEDYLNLLKQTGFAKITIHKEIPAFLPDYGLSITYSAVK